jgi:hypothetical protein
VEILPPTRRGHLGREKGVKDEGKKSLVEAPGARVSMENTFAKTIEKVFAKGHRVFSKTHFWELGRASQSENKAQKLGIVRKLLLKSSLRGQFKARFSQKQILGKFLGAFLGKDLGSPGCL